MDFNYLGKDCFHQKFYLPTFVFAETPRYYKSHHHICKQKIILVQINKIQASAYLL